MVNRKKTIMQIIAGILLLAVIVTGITIIHDKKKQVDQLNLQNANLNTTIQKRDSLVNEMTGTFDEIEKNLTFVREKRSQLTLATAEGNKSKKEMLVDDIRLMNEMLFASSQKIEELEKKLRASGMEIQSFKNKIAELNESILEQDNSIKQLTAQLEQRDRKIAGMDTQISEMQTKIESKTDTIHQKSRIIEHKDNELNKAYYVSGTYKQLLEKGIIKREGGFLGLGKSKDLKDNPNDTCFSEIDQRTTKSFPINSKKAHLITEHPDNSYKFIYQNDQIAYLEIENPAEFWKLTRYLVVETKK